MNSASLSQYTLNTAHTDCLDRIKQSVQSAIQQKQADIIAIQAQIEVLRQDIQLLDQLRIESTLPAAQKVYTRQYRWRLPPVISQLVMDYDAEWTIKFWFVNKKQSSHGSLRRSVDFPLYRVSLSCQALTGAQQFLTDHFQVNLKPIQVTSNEEEYDRQDRDKCFIRYYYNKSV